jgi:hypothetical protein
MEFLGEKGILPKTSKQFAVLHNSTHIGLLHQESSGTTKITPVEMLGNKPRIPQESRTVLEDAMCGLSQQFRSKQPLYQQIAQHRVLH